MCGIAGIYYSNKDKETGITDLRKMTKALRHRGPDDVGFYVKNNIGLAHCRLSIVGLQDRARQPFGNEDGLIRCVCNGEIYNFHDLRKELLAAGHRFKTDNDNEVITHLYEEYGLRFVEKMNGMFALAIWDGGRNRLVLARDRLGIKPLYYYQGQDRVIFASEIKGILADSRFKKEIDPDFLRFYFFYNSIPSPHTAFKHIRSLPPAHLLIFDDRQVKKIKYWSPVYAVDKTITEEHAADEFLRLLKGSIVRHIPKEVDFVLGMSGGIDSNILLALLTEASAKPVKTLSCSFADDVADKRKEIATAEKLAHTFGADHRSFSLSPEDVPAGVEGMVRALDMPVCSFGIDYYLCKQLNPDIKVLFTGDGTEELFGKYWYHRLAQSMVHIIEYYGLDPIKRAEAEKQFLGQYCEIIPQRAFQFSFIYNFLEKDRSSLFREDVLGRLKKEKVSDFIRQHYFNTENDNFLNKILEADLLHFLPDHSLNVIDKFSMAHSVEIRVPFIDHTLVEFAAKIPARLKMRGGITKYLLRKSAEKILPTDVVFGRHAGVTGPPLRRWLTFHLEDYVRSVLSPSRLKKNGIIDPAFVSGIITRHYRLKKNARNFATDNFDSMADDQTIKLWKLILFQVWWERYFL